MIFWHSLKQNYHKDIFGEPGLPPPPEGRMSTIVTSGLVNLFIYRVAKYT